MNTTSNGSLDSAPLPDSQQLEKLLSLILPEILDWMRQGENGSKVLDHIPPQQLSRFLQLDFPTETDQSNDDRIVQQILQILHHSINPWTGRFMDKLYSKTDAIGVVSELLMGVMNANSHVYSTSPALTLIEIETAKKLANMFGFDQNGGGLTMPGGASSNRLSLLTAINNLLPSSRQDGIASLPKVPVIFTSKSSHFSIKQAAMACGLGLRNVVQVRCDLMGRMDVADLRIQIDLAKRQGKQPFYINATAGTTVTGAFDPLEEISQVAKENACWLHVDASWGGPVIFSKTYRSLLNGTEKANSITINPHKLLGVPLQCSFLLLADINWFNANKESAQYLFHGQEYDLGAFTTLCGRRPDALKIFLSWQKYGDQGFSDMVDESMSLFRDITKAISQNPNLELAIPYTQESAMLCVCFCYVPDGYIDVEEQEPRYLADMEETEDQQANHRHHHHHRHGSHEDSNECSPKPLDSPPLSQP